MKSVVWWAPRESCGPLALHGGVGNVINQVRLERGGVRQCVVCVCVRACMCPCLP